MSISFRQQNFLFATACIIYIATAFNSSGYHHWDEHYQIIEFANFKLGKSNVDDLAWEYRAAIRPALQPAICYLVLKLFSALGLENPFTLAFILRAITAIFALITVNQFINKFTIFIRKELSLVLILLSFFLWFLPFINVRFSAETWSGITLLIGVNLIQSETYKKNHTSAFLLGAALGFSILFKYQTALAVTGALLWLICIKKIKTPKLGIVVCGIFIIICLGFLLDKWLYGKYVFTLYNYFNVNLVNDVASSFGRSPWYEYFWYILTAPGPGIGLLILFALIYFIATKPKNVIVWVVLPYFIVHSIIPHKELRFLFPLANFIPFILTVGIQDLALHWMKFPVYLKAFVIYFLISINTIALLKVTSKGAGTTKISVLAHIYKNHRSNPINLIYVGNANPYQELESPVNTFYAQRGINFTPIGTIWDKNLKKYLIEGCVNLLIIPSSEMTGPQAIERLKEFNFSLEYQNVPPFVQWINEWYDPGSNEELISVFIHQTHRPI